MHKLVLLALNTLPIDDRIFPCTGDASHTTDIKLRAVSLTLRTRAVTDCDLLNPASAWTETFNLQKTKSTFKFAPFKT